MPCDYKLYPKNWKEIVKHEKERAGNVCELCGAPNGQIIYRYLFDRWTNTEHFGGKKVKIILTVHHIDGDLKNNKYPNLLVLCQRCHCRLDMGRHIENSRKTRLKNKVKKLTFVS